MANFLEQLNRQAEQGFLTTPKASPKPPVSANAAAATDDKQGLAAKSAAPDTNTEINATNSQQTAAAPQPQRTAQVNQSQQPARAAQAEVYRNDAPEAHRAGIKSTEHDVEIDRNYGRNHFLRIMITVVVCLLLVAGCVMAVRFLTMVELPDFEGKTIAEMRKWCIDNKLYLSEKQVYSMDVGEDFVISQSVEGGTKVAPKKTIDVTYSLGADPSEKISVPDIKSMTAPEIRSWADTNKLSSVKIYEEYSDTEAKGSVIRYEFGSVAVDENSFKRGDSMTVYISRGATESYTAKTVQNFLDKLRSDVESWCTTNKIVGVFTEVLSADVAAGKIISQSVEANKRVESGTSIEFVVSAGPGLVVPDYSKLYKEDAISESEGFDVTLKLIYHASVPYGGFISQSVEAGKRVDYKDNKVTVEYSIGQPYIGEMIGMSETQLPEMFYNFNRQGASLTYTVSYIDSSEAKGTIIESSYRCETVGMHAVVELKVSKGTIKITPPDDTPSETFIIVPDYSNVLMKDASSYNLKLSVTVVMEYSNTVAYGGFISQSASAGSLKTTSNNELVVVYSAGKPFIEDLVGKSESKLPEIFYAFTEGGAAITYEVQYVSSSEPKGTIISASKSNEFISLNENIIIEVSNG